MRIRGSVDESQNAAVVDTSNSSKRPFLGKSQWRDVTTAIGLPIGMAGAKRALCGERSGVQRYRTGWLKSGRPRFW